MQIHTNPVPEGELFRVKENKYPTCLHQWCQIFNGIKIFSEFSGYGGTSILLIKHGWMIYFRLLCALNMSIIRY